MLHISLAGDPASRLPPYLWSPDRSLVAYVLPRTGPDFPITIARVDRSATWTLANQGQLFDDFDEATWSPDGTEIAFPSSRSNQSDLYSVPVDGGPERRLTSNARFERFPVWSPDGSRLAFVGEADGRTDLFYLDRSGATEVRITDDAAVEGRFAWAPDSSRLAYYREVPGLHELVITQLGGLGAQVRVPLDWPYTFPGSLQILGRPAWSPDGSRLAIKDRRGLAVVGADGKGRRSIAGPNGFSPVWSPDGSLIAFAAVEPCELGGIHVIRPDGRERRRLTNDCRIYGTPGADVITGTPHRDVIYAGRGNDRVYPGEGRDLVIAGAGNDRVRSGLNNDVVLGGRGDDVLLGGSQDDRLEGGSGNDRLFGGIGHDKLLGGAGGDFLGAADGERDALRGGLGPDIARVDSRDSVSSVERVVRARGF